MPNIQAALHLMSTIFRSDMILKQKKFQFCSKRDSCIQLSENWCLDIYKNKILNFIFCLKKYFIFKD
jgi:hypothetical protein